MNRSRRASRHVGGLAAMLGLLVVASQPAIARSDGGHGIRDVQFTMTAPSLVGGDFGCDPTDSTRCAGTFRNVRTITGDFAGTTYQVGAAALLPDGTYLGQAVVQFTGTVEGCGSGTLMIQESGILDPVTGGGRGTWVIMSGSGTGDLAQLSGSTTVDSRTSDTWTGTIRCA